MKNRAATIILGFLAAWSAYAENWPQWRGPHFDGSTTETNLPIRWSKTEGVAWAAPLPGYSGATPVVWDDAVFVSSPNAQKELLLICLERKTGKVRWKRAVSAGDREKGRNNLASPSPVTDGHSVFILFATGDMAAFDFSGKQLWERHLAKEYGAFSINWIYGSSPMLYGGKLYVEVLQRNPVPPQYGHAQDGRAERESFVLCLDPGAGKTLWRQLRPSDAVQESMEAYTTPIPYQGANGTEIIILGGDCVTAHHPATGAELWRCGGLNPGGRGDYRMVPTPVAADGMIIACAPKRAPVFGIRDGGKGLVTDTHMAWKFDEFPSDCVTPLFYQKKLFILDGDRQVMTCLNPRTGEKQWQDHLAVREIFRASPTGADGRIYCISENGTVVVLGTTDKFEVISTVSMGEGPVRASVVAAQGHLFIRTAQNLYCLGK